LTRRHPPRERHRIAGRLKLVDIGVLRAQGRSIVADTSWGGHTL